MTRDKMSINVNLLKNKLSAMVAADMSACPRTFFYLEPKLKTRAEIIVVLRLIGVPVTSDPTVAQIHITTQSTANKICFIESDRFAVHGQQGFFDCSAVAKLFQYKNDVRLAHLANYSVPIQLDGLEKNKIIHEFVVNLFQLALTNNLPIAWLWFFPQAARGVLNYRMDVDDNNGNSVATALEQIRSFVTWCSIFFTTAHFTSNPELIHRAHAWGAEIGSHAHYHFTFERDRRSNERNIRASLKFLATLKIPINGCVTPSSKSYPGISHLLNAAGLRYTSNFGVLYDSLPLEIPDKNHSYLEIPIHPICSGNFLKEKATAAITNDELFVYYTCAAHTLAAAYLPIFFYGHNNDNCLFSYLPRLLQFAAENFPDHARLTLGEYADFWQTRLTQLTTFAENKPCKNVALLLPERPDTVVIYSLSTTDSASSCREYPFSLNTFLQSPLQLFAHKQKQTRLTKIMSRHELELILPLKIIDPRSLNGIKKIIFKLLHAFYARRKLFWKTRRQMHEQSSAQNNNPHAIAPLKIAIFGNNVPVVCRTALYLKASGYNVIGIICPQNSKRADRRVFLLHLIERVFAVIIHWCEKPTARVIPFNFRYPTLQTVARLLPTCEIFFVDNHNDSAVADWLRVRQIDVALLAGTGIIKEHILQATRLGFINAHSALLPKYRGAKSEFWIMLNQDFDHLGVTVHWVTPRLDQGKILVQKKVLFVNNDTPDSLRAKTLALAPALFEEALRLIARNPNAGTPQDESQATKFSRPKPEDWQRLRVLYPYV